MMEWADRNKMKSGPLKARSTLHFLYIYILQRKTLAEQATTTTLFSSTIPCSYIEQHQVLQSVHSIGITINVEQNCSGVPLFLDARSLRLSKCMKITPFYFCFMTTASKMPSVLNLGETSLGSTGPGRLKETVNGPGGHIC